MITIAYSLSLYSRGISTARRFSHTKRLKSELAGRYFMQIPLLLVLAAMGQKRFHCVYLGMAGSGVTTCALDFLKDHRCLSHPQARPSISFRDRAERKPTSLNAWTNSVG